jgi:predicted phage terminase large subunit-like protein
MGTATANLMARLNAVEAGVAELHASKVRATAAKDMLTWARELLPEYHSLQSPNAHRELSRELSTWNKKGGRRVNIVGSRDTAKSVVVSLDFVLYAILEWREPYVMVVSETQTQANMLVKTIRGELESNDLLAARYPGQCGEGPEWGEDMLVTRGGTRVEAVGTMKRIRGRRQRSERPTLIVVDDPMGDEHVESVKRRQKTQEWFDRGLMKAGTPDVNVVVVSNAIHREAIGMELSRRPQWRTSVWKSIVRWPERMDLWAQWEAVLHDGTEAGGLAAAERFYRENKTEMDRGAVLLWPDREDLYRLMLLRAENHAAFEAEKQCNPIDPTKCEWPEAFFAWDGLWVPRMPEDKKLAIKVVAVDPSKGKDAKRGDYSAIVRLGRTPGGTLYVEADLERRTTDVLVSDFVETCRNWRTDAAGVESNAYQELLGEDIQIKGEQLGYVVPLNLIENHVNKLVRIRRLTPYLSQKKVRFVDTPGTRLLVDQCKDFPLGTHDDGPDGMEMALRLAIDVSHNPAEAPWEPDVLEAMP